MKKNTGFTLIEIMAVVAIMAIMFTTVIISLNSKSKDKELQDNVNTMKAAISLARNYALTGYEASTATTKLYGYGVFANSAKKYFIYADRNNDQKYNAGDLVLDNYSLDNNAQISGCTPGACDVFFTLYQGDVYADGVAGTDFTITLEHTENADVKEAITVNELTGAIE